MTGTTMTGTTTTQEQELRRLVTPRLEALGVAVDAVDWQKLGALAGLWLHYGRSMNLSGAQDLGGIAAHVVEGLQVVALARSLGMNPGDRWLDVGSGAGFPGLVVASQAPVVITLIEPRDRRAGFLEVGLARVSGQGEVLRGRLDEGGWHADRRERGALHGVFRFASARALFAPERWLRVGAEWVGADGFVLLHLHPGSENPLGVSSSGRMDSDLWSVRAIAGRDVPRGTGDAKG
jgi:16S rRNA (guanine527-N7)-methyltransferase